MTVIADGETSFTSEVSALPTPGHTPGHTSVLISSQGELGIILDDAAHLPLQVHDTDWSPRADADSVLSGATWHQVKDRIEHDGALAISRSRGSDAWSGSRDAATGERCRFALRITCPAFEKDLPERVCGPTMLTASLCHLPIGGVHVSY